MEVIFTWIMQERLAFNSPSKFGNWVTLGVLFYKNLIVVQVDRFFCQDFEKKALERLTTWDVLWGL